jgi:hypothetical protein
MILAALCPTALSAGEWYVDGDGTCCARRVGGVHLPAQGWGTGGPNDPFCNITDAIAAASSGDTIHIAAGVYYENLLLDKDLTLIGTDGQAATIVDGSASVYPNPCVLTTLPNTTIQLEGLRLSNGFGGICAADCALTLLHCSVSGNVLGSGIDASGTTLTMSGSSVTGNARWFGPFGWVDGIGITAVDCALTLLDSTVSENYGVSPGCSSGGRGGGIYAAGGTLTLVDSIVANNLIAGSAHGCGIYAAGTALTIERSTITGNVSCGGAWGAGIWTDFGSIKNTIVWGNGSYSSGQIHGSPTVEYSDVQSGWSGTGNIDADPLFVDAAEGDYRLLPGSPCIDRGDPTATAGGVDPWGNPRLLDGDLDGVMAVDMGAHEFDWVHLDVTGEATPGGSVIAEATWAGEPPVLPWGIRPSVTLFVGAAPAEILLSPYGAFFIDPTAPWMSFRIGTASGSLTLAIPPNWPAGLELVLQSVTMVPPFGNLSNPVYLTIE